MQRSGIIPKGRMAVLAVIAVLGGCASDNADLRAWVEQEKALPGAPIPPLPVLKTFETFEYHDQAQRDPFAPSAEEIKATETESSVMPDPHAKEKLEEYPLDSLHMVGTLGAGNSLEALVKDPDGTVSRVHLRNYLGQNNGKVRSISEKRIDLVELIANGYGGWTERQASIELGAK
jgi:type IV pilus assembly protein PilP